MARENVTLEIKVKNSDFVPCFIKEWNSMLKKNVCVDEGNLLEVTSFKPDRYSGMFQFSKSEMYNLFDDPNSSGILAFCKGLLKRYPEAVFSVYYNLTWDNSGETSIENYAANNGELTYDIFTGEYFCHEEDYEDEQDSLEDDDAVLKDGSYYTQVAQEKGTVKAEEIAKDKSSLPGADDQIPDAKLSRIKVGNFFTMEIPAEWYIKRAQKYRFNNGDLLVVMFDTASGRKIEKDMMGFVTNGFQIEVHKLEANSIDDIAEYFSKLEKDPDVSVLNNQPGIGVFTRSLVSPNGIKLQGYFVFTTAGLFTGKVIEPTQIEIVHLNQVFASAQIIDKTK